jgi:very-short-patch-repair endonuclease
LAKNEEDFDRQKFLEDEGYTVLRFSEGRVIYRIDEVVAEIDYAIQCIEQKMKKKQKNNGCSSYIKQKINLII